MNDLLALYHNRIDTDLELKAESESFPVHRSILMARSSVFRDRFLTDTYTKIIEIEDIDIDILKRLIFFIYTDKIEEITGEDATKLHVAANVFGIKLLKQKCFTIVKEILCSSNVCGILDFTDKHRDLNIKAAAQQYILANSWEVFETEQWKYLMQKNACVAGETMYLKLKQDRADVHNPIIRKFLLENPFPSNTNVTGACLCTIRLRRRWALLAKCGGTVWLDCRAALCWRERRVVLEKEFIRPAVLLKKRRSYHLSPKVLILCWKSENISTHQNMSPLDSHELKPSTTVSKLGPRTSFHSMLRRIMKRKTSVSISEDSDSRGVAPVSSSAVSTGTACTRARRRETSRASALSTRPTGISAGPVDSGSALRRV
ncbi:TD and POZ domain-containing protein 5 [Trichonephila clavata]|uniref:TD and POZ domain-containing protein 5 n=1 Tax=Trichonephila clavata TaxID=2740835 RepID=A0A8X6KX36_TRICU|nr:TD and POZ domain-containing protein 5 [Trichonephila clavata]